MNRLLSLLSLMLLVYACGTPKTVQTTTIEERQLDTLFVTAPPIEEDEKDYTLPVYNPSATQHHDLLHTRLDLSFDWEKEQVKGIAHLDLKPYFYATDQLVLDAKGFVFNNIALADGTKLNHTYNGTEVTIQLPKAYTRQEKFTVVIDYLATPRGEGGSSAITSDKGLFFINPRGEEPGKPKQIWTQGETENNSRWFPTIDKPNERCTQEMYITVEDKYVTLSNGLLVTSTKNTDGTRTDYWKMNQPHAPYLFMLAVGDFAVVKDEPWNGKPVAYYVEPKFREHAKAIFPHTPEMLTFFSGITGVSYPWQKYSQIVVRDYVSGAMENTTGVIFGEFVQKESRELIDELLNDKIVAHEMFHHWFGDYVTCESWANLTLNEGFANYSEYLWLEQKYGRDEADAHLLQEWEGYLGAARDGIHPLIHYGYDDKEDMFDAHSYNKGGSILHMLRKIVGDEAFFASIQRYLEQNAFTEVEVAELRMAFEETTGQDMHWFFDQWFLQEGHPQIALDYDYDAATQEAIIRVKQLQDAREMPAIFQLIVEVDVYQKGASQPTRHRIKIDRRQQEVRLPASSEPALIVFDAERCLLAEWEDNKSEEQLAYQFMYAPRYLDRYQALSELGATGYEGMDALLQKGLQDPYHGIRALALNFIDETTPSHILDVVAATLSSDSHSSVRAAAVEMLAALGHQQAASIANRAIGDPAYPVVAAGITALSVLDPMESVKSAARLQGESNPSIVAALGTLYANTGDASHLPYFVSHLEDVDGFGALEFYESYSALLLQSEGGALSEGVAGLRAIGINQVQSPWRRLAAIKTLSEMKAELEAGNPVQAAIQTAIDAIKTAETNQQLKGIYQQF